MMSCPAIVPGIHDFESPQQVARMSAAICGIDPGCRFAHPGYDWIEPEVSLADSYGFNPRELSNMLRTVAGSRDLILRAWHDHFGN
jgi:hypothetical protein